MSFQWNVSLSDGRRVSMKDLEKEGVNPWHELVNYVKNNKDVDGSPLRMTHLELIVNSQRYNSPTCGKNSIFKSSQEPKYFWIIGTREGFLVGDESNAGDFISLSYRIGDYRHFVWVNLATNFVYNQVLNVINPVSLEEKEFIGTESHLVSLWGG